MIRLKKKSYNAVLTEKQQNYQHLKTGEKIKRKDLKYETKIYIYIYIFIYIIYIYISSSKPFL